VMESVVLVLIFGDFDIEVYEEESQNNTMHAVRNDELGRTLVFASTLHA
jgi:hypothetical protein